MVMVTVLLEFALWIEASSVKSLTEVSRSGKQQSVEPNSITTCMLTALKPEGEYLALSFYILFSPPSHVLVTVSSAYFTFTHC